MTDPLTLAQEALRYAEAMSASPWLAERAHVYAADGDELCEFNTHPLHNDRANASGIAWLRNHAAELAGATIGLHIAVKELRAQLTARDADVARLREALEEHVVHAAECPRTTASGTPIPCHACGCDTFEPEEQLLHGSLTWRCERCKTSLRRGTTPDEARKLEALEALADIEPIKSCSALYEQRHARR